MVHKTSQTVPLTSFLSLKPSVGRQDKRFKHGGVQRHCYVKIFTSYWPKINGFQTGHDKYRHKWLRVKNTNKTKSKRWLRIHTSAALELYTVVIHNMSTHFLSHYFSLFTIVYSSYYSSISCERVHVWSHWHTATYFNQCCNKAMWYWKEQFH